MKINAIYSYNSSFTSNKSYLDEFQDESEQRQMGEDDYYGSSIRNALRAHMYSQIMPAYQPEDELYGYHAETIEDVHIPNLQKLYVSCYRGATLAKTPQYLNLLKKSGVYTVIDLVGYERLKNACSDTNIDYYKYEVGSDYWNNSIFKTDEELFEKFNRNACERGLNVGDYSKELELNNKFIKKEREKFMDNFISLVNVINQGNFYIGCEFGEMRTPNILALNSYFNPEWCGQKTRPSGEFVLNLMKNMYVNLSDKDKSRLGFTEEFEADLREKLGIKKAEN